MTQVYPFGTRKLCVEVSRGGADREPTQQEMDVWIQPVIRREEKRGHADALTITYLREALQFIGNGGRFTLGAITLVDLS